MQSKEFTNIVASNEAFYQINLQLLSNGEGGSDTKEKATLDKLATDMAERLDDKVRKFLSQENSKSIEKDLWVLAEDEAANIKISPEDYAL